MILDYISYNINFYNYNLTNYLFSNTGKVWFYNEEMNNTALSNLVRSEHLFVLLILKIIGLKKEKKNIKKG